MIVPGARNGAVMARLSRARPHLAQAAWPIIDQGVVSLGAFGVMLVLARAMPPAGYGAFALLMSAFMTLQLVTASLVYYPMSVRCGLPAKGSAATVTLSCGLALLPFLLVPLLAVVAGGLLMLRRPDLIGASLLYLALWQIQEALRRSLFCEFRHREALAGDLICYAGQSAVVLVLAWTDTLNLTNALYGMAAAAACAALVQWRQLRPPLAGPLQLVRTAKSFAAIGGWALLNNLVLSFRTVPLLWLVGALYGAGGTASLQSLFNVVNLSNPLLLGLCNVLPQVAARARGGAAPTPWAATRPYIAAGSALILLFALVLILAPGIVLGVIYGAASPYAGLTAELRVLTISVLCAYLADMVCSVLHGLDQPQQALLINAAGTIAAVSAAIPLTVAFGLLGASIAVSLGALVRLLASRLVISRMTIHEPRAI